jgi:hypothetical protein
LQLLLRAGAKANSGVYDAVPLPKIVAKLVGSTSPVRDNPNWDEEEADRIADKEQMDFEQKPLQLGYHLPYELQPILLHASAKGHVKVVQALLDAYADINAVNKEGMVRHFRLIHFGYSLSVSRAGRIGCSYGQ